MADIDSLFFIEPDGDGWYDGDGCAVVNTQWADSATYGDHPLSCPGDCGCVARDHYGTPVTVVLDRDSNEMLHPNPLALVIHRTLAEIIRPEMTGSAVWGECRMRSEDGPVSKEYVSVYCPVECGVFLRGSKTHDCRVCSACGLPTLGMTTHGTGPKYIPRNQLGPYNVYLNAGAFSLFVTKKMRQVIVESISKPLKFYQHLVFEEPLDGRNFEIDDRRGACKASSGRLE